MLLENYKTPIVIDGVKCDILSYMGMMMLEPFHGDYGVSPSQYLAILFNNLGYDKYPKDTLWMHNGIDVVNVEKTEVMDYPITHSTLMLKDNDTLHDILLAIWYWSKSGLERGKIMEPLNSFSQPDAAELAHCIENRIKIRWIADMREYPDIWERSNIYMRRYYHASPDKDGNYFDHCLGANLMDAAKQIQIDDPYSLFILGLVNIDLLFDIIRTSEIVATKQAFNANRHSIPIPLMDLNVVLPYFSSQIKSRAHAVSNIYHSVGASGLLTGDRQSRFVGKYKEIEKFINPCLINDKGKRYVSATINDDLIVNDIAYKIAIAPLYDAHLTYIYRYVEKGSLKDIDELGENSIERALTLKKLYYTLNQLEEYQNGILNEKDKLIFSMEFYIDPDKWALYSKNRRTFFIATDNFYLLEASAQETLDYYEFKLGKVCFLDSREMGTENIQSERVPSYDIFELEKVALSTTTTPIDNIPKLQQPYPSVVYEPSKETYGFDNLEGIITDYTLPD